MNSMFDAHTRRGPSGCHDVAKHAAPAIVS
jgi:hypothetical protein